MRKISIPMQIPELNLKPPISGQLEVSDNVQQVLSQLLGYSNGQRTVIKSSASGILYTESPRIKDIVHYTATSGNYTTTGGNVPCSGAIVLAHPDNGGRIWVKPYATAETTNAWPLDAGDGLPLSVDNLNQINLLIVVDTEIAIVAYTI